MAQRVHGRDGPLLQGDARSLARASLMSLPSAFPPGSQSPRDGVASVVLSAGVLRTCQHIVGAAANRPE